jgi:hypothetical protein
VTGIIKGPDFARAELDRNSGSRIAMPVAGYEYRNANTETIGLDYLKSIPRCNFLSLCGLEAGPGGLFPSKREYPPGILATTRFHV